MMVHLKVHQDEMSKAHFGVTINSGIHKMVYCILEIQ